MAKKTKRIKAAKRCIIWYKRGILESGQILGDVFDKIEPCCDTIRRWFEVTGNHRITSFGQSSGQQVNGMNLNTSGLVPKLEMRLYLSQNNSIVDEISSCPFCEGAKIEIQCTKNVVLRARKKEVFDGYTEGT